MARPSMFSKDYEKRMKRRRLNTILFILIIISAAYFGGKYYLNKNNVNISLFKIKKTAENKVNDDKKQAENLQKTQKAEQTQKTEQTQQKPVQVEKKTEKIQYKSTNGKIYEIELVVNDGQVKEIKSLKEETGTVKYDISIDKKFIVFEDKASNDIILGMVDGSFKKISRDSYKSVSKGKIYSKEKILSWYPGFIWAQKPKFTSDGRVVYISDLPYMRNDNDLYVWTVNTDGSNHKRIGTFKGSVDSVTYEGIDSDNSLRVKINENVYAVSQGSYRLEKR